MRFILEKNSVAVAFLMTAFLLVGADAPPAQRGSSFELLRGAWTVTRILASGPVTGLTDSEARAIIGRRVQYAPTEAVSGTTHLAVREYTTRRMTQDEFFTENKISARRAGLRASSIVEISLVGARKSIADQFGTTAYLLDHDTAVVPFEGIYFELRRNDARQ